MTALSIGAATLDTPAAVLRGPDRTVPLGRQPLRLLARLAMQPGRAVLNEHLGGSLHDPYGRANVDLMQSHMVAVRRALRLSGSGASVATIYAVGARLDVPAADTPAECTGRAA